MRRRDLLIGAGAFGVLGAGSAVAFGAVDPFSADDQIEPVELERFDAPGSAPGVETVPEPGRVTFLGLFATWCSICQRKMDPLSEAAGAVGDDVQFVSVTNEPVGLTVDRQDVIDWWIEYEGNWPVALDDDLELTRRVDGPGVPYSIVFDEDNQITWRDSGYKIANEVLERIEQAGGTVDQR